MSNPQIGQVDEFEIELNTLVEIVNKLEPLQLSFTEILNFILSTLVRNIR